MKLHISPCPNDTFTFHAMIHQLVDTEGLAFEPEFDDIDVLNSAAIDDAAAEDIVKISYAALPQALTAGLGVGLGYRLLESGGALGHGNGPLLVSRHKIYTDELHDVTIGVPGLLTTANRLLSIIYPDAQRKQVRLFSQIAEAVADGELDAGVLIHEGRFTYAKQGLRLVADMGAEWDKLTGLPIPLGGILISRKHSATVGARVSRIVRRSIEFAQKNPAISAAYVKAHAQELSQEVREKHISYFVNNYSLSMGDTGIEAVLRLTGLDILELEYV